MNRIYSPEPFENYLLTTTGTNGSIIKSISFNRNNRNSSLYITLKNTGRIIPTVLRGYYNDDGLIVYKRKIYPIIEVSSDNKIIVFDYDEYNDYNYVTYKIQFEVISNSCEMTVDQIGLSYNIELTTSNIKSYSTSLLTDVNNNPLYRQSYSYNLTFGIIANRTDFEEILNVIDKPFYLVNVLNNCIDLSSGLLVATGISPRYITNSTKMVEYTISNIGA